jgi:sortase (surface protein transpeptidase)
VSLARSWPVRLEIPALALGVSLTTLGLNPNGTVQVPSTTTVAGWYRDGPSPGQVGSAVILGHVDSYRGIGIFFYLRTLRPGDQIEVILADGQHPTFRVTRVAQYAKSAFPDRAVYASHGVSALQLVTCGGVFDHATGSYESNIVVYSVRV